jgi:hypothetical protein
VDAIARELVRRYIVPDIAILCSLGQQVSDYFVDLELRSSDPLVLMEERREFGVVPMDVSGVASPRGVRRSGR